MTAPFAGLNELRIDSAHIGNPALETAFKLLGCGKTIPQTPRAGWELCVDAIEGCLETMSSIFK
jgi:hypothetical protein